VKLAASEHEDAWKNAGKAVGIQIWRIEKFKVHAVDPNTYGTFYSGDSYIVLWTYKPKPDSPALAWDVHFWLGKHTSQDEAGTAAYKTVELDDTLHGAAVQWREVQAHESSRFMTYFPKGVKLLKGGVESGFHHVKPEEYRPRLLQFKGKRHVRVHEVEFNANALNSGDVFLLDLGRRLIQWNGSQSSPMEKNKAAEIVEAIESERDGKASKVVIAESDADNDSDVAEFWKQLGGRPAKIHSAAEGGPDAEAEALADKEKVLLKMTQGGGKFDFSEVGRGMKIQRAALVTSDVFILDTGNEVYAWVGKKAPVEERKHAIMFAQEYVTKHGKPVTSPVARVLEGAENHVFDVNFH